MNLFLYALRAIYGHRLPRHSGEVQVPGISAPVTIRRTQHGVPCIDAENPLDALFGLGVCVGQDRAFQLELARRVVHGTLSEIVGIKGLPIDRISRRIGFRRASLEQLEAVAPDILEQLSAYARGVTRGMTLSRPAHEFALLGCAPSAWDAADVLGLLKLQTFQLPSNFDCELARLRILLADGPDALLALDPVNLPVAELPLQRPAIAAGALDALANDLGAFWKLLPIGGGSNNWVIHGSRTASGQAILANDPHLAPGLPAPWYLAMIDTPTWKVAGATLAGTPVFPCGHNGYACWGVTAGLTDQTDLYRETVQPDGTIVGATTLTELIRIQGQPDHTEVVTITPRGPVITPLDGLGEVLSLRAIWLMPLPVRGFLDSPTARDFTSFRKAFAHWPGFPMNLVYADESGTIGWQLCGQIPKRTVGHGYFPMVAGASEWEPDLVPFEQMPYAENPSVGYYATANETPGVPDGGPFLGGDFIDAYRARTIRRALAARTDWTPMAVRELQRNQDALAWEELREPVANLPATDPDAAEGKRLLAEWDGVMGAESPAAAVFELWTAEMIRRTAQAKAPNSWQHALGGTGDAILGSSFFCERRLEHLVRLIQTQPPGFFTRSWPDELADALAHTIRTLRTTAGPGASFWAWGHLRVLRLRHLLLGKTWLGRIFNRGPVPLGGSTNTIAAGGARSLDPTGETHNIAGLRAVFEVGNWSASRFVLCGGQSGNPWSANYDDQFPLWQTGEAITIPWTTDEVLREAKSAFRLQPIKLGESDGI